MPTNFTNQAGRMALTAACAWVVASILVGAKTWFGENDWSTPLYIAVMGAVTVGGVLALVAMIGLSKRLGGLGVVGLVGIVLVGVGVAFGFIATWAVPVWMSIQGLGLLLIAVSALGSTEVPRVGVVAVGSAFLLGTIGFTVGNIMEIGWRDQWGDRPVAWFVGFAVGAVVLAVGLAIVGRWLAGEEPAGIDTTPIAA
jgi:hypothetical protein